MTTEGVHKFQFQLKKAQGPEKKFVHTLEKWRIIFFKLGFIGEYKTEQVGYGNLSMKVGEDEQFVITGTQTGKLPNLTANHYVTVTKCNLDKMKVEAKGPIAPSSEALTHYAVYIANPKVKFVFHIHHEGLWKMMIKNGDTATSEAVDYGTQEMANEAKEIVSKKDNDIFVMKGHQDGIIAYGEDENEVANLIMEKYRQYQSQQTNS
jgi:ribulose-5-phosphate 4-epimerase/fuculose-1-phosphate aldolase